MQNAWVLIQEILINPELYHPCILELYKSQRHMWQSIVLISGYDLINHLLHEYSC